MSVAQRLRSALDPREAAEWCREQLASADVLVDGERAWDIHINDARFFERVLRDGTLGVGESYVDGWWDAEALDQTIDRLMRARLGEVVPDGWPIVVQTLRARVLNLQSKTRSFGNGQHHYDIGNELYEAMLDRRMLYTCAYWPAARTLDEAQQAKLELVCGKLGLQAGMRVLDLGCGWGGFAAYAAERYGVSVVGYTVSREQVRWAHERYAHLPVEIRLDDYRNATGRYDAVVSIGLMEHVGPKNYRAYMELADRCLEPHGIAFVHTIGGNQPRTHMEPWFDKYIFPNAVLPTLAQLVTAMEGVFVPEDIHNIGEDYDRTLMAWWHNFDHAWPALRDHYDTRFHRMWKYYLLASAGAFRARAQQLFQLVMTRPGTRQPPHRRG
jgi:cyclopropane-fatty-acyl-phospholipid synthase